MKPIKLILLLIAICFVSDAVAQVTFEKDFGQFLQYWSTRATTYSDNAHSMKLLLWGGGILTLAAATIPFVDNKIVKIISFVLALGGTAITQYLITFEVDPKMISKKATIIQIKLEEFENKVRNANLTDPQIANQFLLEKRQLEKELMDLDHEIRGVGETKITAIAAIAQSHFQIVSYVEYQDQMGCVPTNLNPENGQFTIQGLRVEIPVSVSNLIKYDTTNLYLSAAGVDSNLAYALGKTDSCIIKSLRNFITPFTGQSPKTEQIVTDGILKLADDLYKNYQKNGDGTYQAFRIARIPRDMLLNFYSDVYGNFEKQNFKQLRNDFILSIKETKVIKN